MKTYLKVVSIWTVNILILLVVCVLIRKLDLYFRRDPSFDSFVVNTGDGCVGANHTMVFASNSLLVVDYELSGLSLSQIDELDTLVSTVIGIPKSTSIVWWEKSENVSYKTHLVLVSTKLSGVTRRSLGWNGCFVNELFGQSTSLAYVDMQFNWSWTVATFLHERAHSYGAVHGKDGKVFNFTVDFADAAGPNDAHWWTNVGMTAIERTCNDQSDQLFTSVCKRVQNILHVVSK